ncbi:GGDEF domain-containing protein [Pseudomonas fulva]|uniref:GGDEF domain-containing protein n=1 Tax=Pseudomonas fulva TaxID=47880 RepID=UPI002DBECE13|nr:GGDEF domain-containing protein [Pseudomonas fulva]MEC4024671.1 GGDEF domain-containing protein [Pseudomonas fulva]
MTEEAERWKEKYLISIEQQEKLERRWEARLDLLRRGLVRSTLAAEGSDKVVDQCMKEMREVIRSDNMDAGLAGLIPRLEKAVLESEQRRETRMHQVGDALTALVDQLQGLPLSSDVSRPLKKLAKRLEAGVTQSRDLPPLLGELSGLQGRALAALDRPEGGSRGGFLQRLFKGRDEPAPVEAASEQVTGPAPVAAQPLVQEVSLLSHHDGHEGNDASPSLIESEHVPGVEPPPIPPAPPMAMDTPLRTEADDGPPPLTDVPLSDQDAYALPYAVEPPYSQVAAHIEQTLLGLLDDLSLPDRHKAQAQAMRERVARGMNWYELIPVLDDLAVLLLAITDSGQHEFETYLQLLNERLEGFHGHLQAASAGHADNSSAARQLDTQLREQVDGLQTDMQGAADVSSLKHLLESRLEGLLMTMDQHQHERDRREQALAGRLQGLSERVASMEQEALGYREHLEEQRQKALLDPLTGLPNRAAWSEQVEREMQRWQENGGDLAMAILDLDHFKQINDGYGHLAGDKVLKIVADQLRKRLRGQDFIARFGGEEFVLLLPDTSPADALQVVETMRLAVEACPFHFKGERVVVSTSIGLSAFRPGEVADQVLKRADAALYRAKQRGRNCVEQH